MQKIRSLFVSITLSHGLLLATAAPPAGKQWWGFMNREGEPPCVPLSLIDPSFKKAMTLEQAMAIYSPSGYQEKPFSMRGTSEAIAMYWPANLKAPLMTKASCDKPLACRKRRRFVAKTWRKSMHQVHSSVAF